MENFVLKSVSVPPLRSDIRTVALRKRSLLRCQYPRGLVVYNQQRICRTISSSYSLRSNSSRRIGKRWTSNTVKYTTRIKPGSVRMGLGSDTGKETHASRSTWSYTDNLRCVLTLLINAPWSSFLRPSKALTYFFCLSYQQCIQSRRTGQGYCFDCSAGSGSLGSWSTCIIGRHCICRTNR